MPSEFDQQFSVSAAPILSKQFGVRVQLKRTGSAASATFTCPFSRIIDEVNLDEDALGTAIERRTWNPLKADLVISVAVEPRAGDILQLVDSSDTLTGEQHEITPNGSDRAVEEHPGGDSYIIRTKRIA